MKVDYLENIALEDMLKASATGLDAVHDAILDYTNTMNDASEGDQFLVDELLMRVTVL